MHWEEAPKHLLKPNLSWREIMISVWWSGACLIHYSLLNSSETIQLRSMLNKLVRGTENCNACGHYWSTEWAQFSTTMSDRMSHVPNASKVERTGLQSFASSTIFTWPLANQLPLLQAPQQHFATETLPQPAGGRRCFPRVSQVLIFTPQQ